MPVKPAFYIVNNSKGDNIETPNSFLFDYKGDITLKDIIKSFPLSKLGDYHYRFRVAEGRSDSIWIDITDLNEVIPLYNDYVFMKCLRCDTIGIQSKYMLNQKSESSSSSSDKHHHHKDKDKEKEKDKDKKEKRDKEKSSEKDKDKKDKDKDKDKKEKRDKEKSKDKDQSPQIQPQPTPQPVQQQKPQTAPVQQTKPSSTPIQQQQQQPKPAPAPVPVQPPPPAVQQEDEEEEEDDNEELSESEEEVDLFGGGKPKADKTLSQFTGVSYDGKSASVVKAMKKRERELKRKQEEARIEMERQKDMIVKIQEEKDRAIELHGQKIQQWAEENGVKRDIRGLLATMQNVLWEGSGWTPINIGDLLADGKVKMGYFKASRIVHPDKTVDCTPEQKLIAERIFDALNQAWNKFQAESS